MSDPLTLIRTRFTAQNERARADQAINNAGGYGWQVDDWARLDRFLILGTTDGTYYVGEKELTREHADIVIRLAATDGRRLVDTIVGISESGRAPKQNPTLFALAAAAGCDNADTRAYALAALPRVCRIGTHLFIFARYVEQFRGWGRQLRRAVAAWYTEKPVDKLAYQLVKYRQREGWSHRDLLRLSHPATTDPARRAAFDFACGRLDALVGPIDGLDAIEGFLLAQTAGHSGIVADLIGRYRLPWEAIPDKFLSSPEVWEALLPHMGQTALIRNLARLTNIGLIAPMSTAAKQVAADVADPDRLRDGRVHPLAVLSALITYASGHGVRGSLEWSPVREVVDALDSAFYAAFGSVTPSGKRTLLALDVSGSMTMDTIAGVPGVTPRQGSAAMALVTAATESQWAAMAFSGGFVPLPLSNRQRLDDVLRMVGNLPFDRTDCSLPMLWAMQNNVAVDTFVVYTDSETWSGNVHPFQALRAYRDRSGIPARLVVVGMVSNGFTIADPSDPGMMDVVGFDTAAPDTIAAFSRGEF